MITQLQSNLMQATAAEIGRSAEAGRRAAGLAGERPARRSTGRALRGRFRLTPALRHS